MTTINGVPMFDLPLQFCSMGLRILFSAVIIALAISCTLSATIFEDLPLSKRLSRRANRSIQSLKYGLNNMFVCGQGCSCGRGWNRNRFNSAGKNEQYQFTVPQLRCQHKHKNKRAINRMARKLRRQIERTADILDEVKEAFADYNNVVVGDGNGVAGDDNFVIGDYNELSGDSNWVFSSKVYSQNPLDGVLIVGTFVIQLEDLLATDKGIDNMIHCTGDSDSANRRERWWKATHNHVTI